MSDRLLSARSPDVLLGITCGGAPTKLKFKVWLEKDNHVLFGRGRVELLKAIDECHSLSAAAKELSMSYRAAWGRLQASERRLGCNLVEHHQGRQMRLTS
jgi:molybdate transport system regulatory protein